MTKTSRYFFMDYPIQSAEPYWLAWSLSAGVTTPVTPGNSSLLFTEFQL